MNLPRIGVTLGDPGGIGPEIVVKSLADLSSLSPAEYVIFGERSVLQAEERALGLSLDIRVSVQEISSSRKAGIYGRADAANGMASFLYFQKAVEAARSAGIQAIVTAPISKTSWGLAGMAWRGHTEYLERFYPKAVMLFRSERLTVALLSHHLPLKEAIAHVTREMLAEFFRVLQAGLAGVRKGQTEFLVAGLNPHAGESGLLGREELEEIIPAIEEARAAGIPVSGPYPPDVVFRSAWGRPEKVVIALYHDQGLIAFKLAAFETGVNVTLGLPFVRTSPDHGTAFDIAGKNMADPRSMIEALKLAGALASGAL